MENAKIYTQMLAVLADVAAIGKNQKNTSQGYAFRGIDDMMNGLHPLFAKHGIFVMPEVIHSSREERPTKDNKGILICTLLDIKFTAYADDGSSVSAVVRGEGMDSGDKSGNKAMSAALKYFLMQAFLVPTADIADGDLDNPEPGETIDQAELKRKEEELSDKLAALPDNIKAGFKALGYTRGNVRMFCEAHKWDNEQINLALNAIADEKAAKNGE